MAQNCTNWKVTFDVLEPVKAPLNPYRDVGVLIDITDEKDKDKDIKLSGSDLDNIKKQNFDLLDLYENIYVTPQHVQKPEKDEWIVESPQRDHDKFFQKLEAGEKIDWSANASTSKDFLLNNIIDDIDGKYTENESKEDESFERSISHIIHKNLDIPRVLKVPKVNELQCEIDQIEKKIENSIGYNINMKIEKGIDVKKTENLTTGNNLTANIVNANKLKTSAEANVRFINDNIVSMLDKPFKNIDLNKISETLIQNRISQNFGAVNNSQPKHNIEMIKTVTLDKKTYAKTRQVRTEVEKLRFTKGPDIYEKSVVLPQIMKRLMERERMLQEESNVRRRLVLDSSKRLEPQCQCKSKTVNETSAKVKVTKPIQVPTKSSGQVSPNKEVKLNPVIAMENCNRERLIAYKVHSAFQKYVLTGSYY